MQQVFGISKVGPNQYSILTVPKWNLLFFSILWIVIAVAELGSYINGLHHKDKDGNNIKWTYHISTLIVSILSFIIAFMLAYAYIYLN